ncbi:MAG: hypothetical protein DI616_18540 [Paracoccus denitrificans]|uniref:Uncharacterized protein n=1 Tax=Paracoccus denitrificans TaxID=266 RepID=A0A533HZU2_PARDE|nr:MAG: hypothetical protein DI616_18540 [Paracoccus denitrificans]
MVCNSPNSRRGAALSLGLLALPGLASADQLQPFTNEIRMIVPDWEAEEWDDGEIKLHPDMYTWQSDIHLTLRAAEPLAGRSAMDIARLHFDGFELDDDTLEPTVVSMDGADTSTAGMITTSYNWVYGFDQNFSMFGTVQLADDMVIPFHANCVVEDEDYDEERCLTGIFTILQALRGVGDIQLAMPEPPAPISVPFWASKYDASGATILSNGNFTGTVTARVIVTAPMDIPARQLSAEIEAFSDNMIDDIDDQADKHPGTRQWVGSQADPWFRRDFPEAFSGPSTIMTGSQKTVDGKTVLIGVRCPNPGWQGSCARAVSMSRQQIASGQAEARRGGIVSQSWGGFPDGGLTNSGVDSVYMVGEGSSATGMYTMVFEAYLLLKDGRICTCFDRALGQIVPAESQIETPESWGHWVNQNGNINIVWFDGEMETLDMQAVTKMAGGDAETRIQGNFTHISAGGNPLSGTSHVSRYFFTFQSDGTFSSNQSSAFSVSAGGIPGGDTVAAGGSSGSGPQGRYEIDGFNMKLTYPDGRIQWMGFAQAADEVANPAKSQLMLDGIWFYNDDQ